MSKTELIKETDKIFSLVIRRMYRNEDDICRCASCNQPLHYTQITCGHWRKRRHMQTRWNIKNAAPQCTMCNLSDEEKNLKLFLIDKHGQEEVDKVFVLSNITRGFNAVEIKEILHQLKQLL